MNWEAIGAIGEISGALAVVLTLLYLARQISESRKATIAQIYQGRADAASRSIGRYPIGLDWPPHWAFLMLMKNWINSATKNASSWAITCSISWSD